MIRPWDRAAAWPRFDFGLRTGILDFAPPRSEQ